MKNRVLRIFCIILLFTCMACGSAENIGTKEPEIGGDEETFKPQSYTFHTQCARIGSGYGNLNLECSEVIIICSRAELDHYYETKKERYNLEYITPFLDVCKKYDDAFFEENDLIMILTSWGGITYQAPLDIKEIRQDADGIWNITVQELIQATDYAEAWYHLFAEVPGKFLKEDDIINIDVERIAIEKYQEQNSFAFETKYIRTEEPNDVAEYPEGIIIRSKEELDAYCKAHPNREGIEDLLKACREYDSAYFEENDLILILAELPSNSSNHEVTNIYYEDPSDMWYVTVDQNTPWERTEGKMYEYIFITPQGGKVICEEDELHTFYFVKEHLEAQFVKKDNKDKFLYVLKVSENDNIFPHSEIAVDSIWLPDDLELGDLVDIVHGNIIREEDGLQVLSKVYSSTVIDDSSE